MLNLSKTDINVIFGAIDFDADGEVTFDDFMSFLNGSNRGGSNAV